MGGTVVGMLAAPRREVPLPLARDWPDPQAASATAIASTPRPAARPHADGAGRRPTAKGRCRRRSGVRERLRCMWISVASWSSVEGSAAQEKAARTREAASLTAESATGVTAPIWKKPWIILS